MLPDEDDFLLSCDEVRSIDRAAMEELGLSGVLLMENAARGVCDAILRETPQPGNIRILCGPGNNGGDGLALARQLSARDRDARVFLVTSGKELTPDADFNRRVWLAAGGSVEDGDQLNDLDFMLRELSARDLVVDCLLGTGVRGAVRDPFRTLIAAVNQSPARVLAVDVPSGLDCDTGVAAGECIRADRTVTFVGRKRGFAAPTAAEFTGTVEVAHIGTPASWVKQWLSRYRAGLG